MNMVDKVRADARAALFDVLDNQSVGMLGAARSEQALQPMTHSADRDTAELWFITSKQTDLVGAVGLGAPALYCVTAPGGDFFTCLTGTLEQSEDEAKLDEIWSTAAAAWFGEGREDHDIALLRLTVQEAAIWTATDSSFVFGLEIARASLSSEHKPDIGGHVVIRF